MAPSALRAVRLDLAFLLYGQPLVLPAQQRRSAVASAESADPALPPVQEPPSSPACERVEADVVIYAALDASGRVVCQLCRSEDFAHLVTSGHAQRFDRWRRPIFALEARRNCWVVCGGT
ncbi:MAG: hypothetical protein GY772_06990 [bacterium]|nr:hypothetical protein [bacterium]